MQFTLSRCEFDTGIKNKLEKHYQHDEEQHLRFYKKVHIKTYRPSNKKNVLVMLSFYFLRRTKMYCKKRRISTCLFDKSRNQDDIKCHVLHEKNDLNES